MRLGPSVEGRDEKGIKKTICAFLKILYPADEPSDEEFEQYAIDAVECRRRIKEQMNKRKDNEFVRIDLSYVDNKGKETVVYCPESQHAAATLEPARRPLQRSSEEKILSWPRHPSSSSALSRSSRLCSAGAALRASQAHAASSRKRRFQAPEAEPTASAFALLAHEPGLSTRTLAIGFDHSGAANAASTSRTGHGHVVEGRPETW